MKIIRAILNFIWEGGSYPPGAYYPPPSTTPQDAPQGVSKPNEGKDSKGDKK